MCLSFNVSAFNIAKDKKEAHRQEETSRPGKAHRHREEACHKETALYPEGEALELFELSLIKYKLV